MHLCCRVSQHACTASPSMAVRPAIRTRAPENAAHAYPWKKTAACKKPARQVPATRDKPCQITAHRTSVILSRISIMHSGGHTPQTITIFSPYLYDRTATFACTQGRAKRSLIRWHAPPAGGRRRASQASTEADAVHTGVTAGMRTLMTGPSMQWRLWLRGVPAVALHIHGKTAAASTAGLPTCMLTCGCGRSPHMHAHLRIWLVYPNA